jgi:hypothetical protein
MKILALRFMSVLQVGEFVEVSNGSKTDPCGWLGRVSSIGKTFTVRL